MLLERSSSVGGLVGNFIRDGFVFDRGIRAIENSGTVFPMLRQLGIDIEFVKNNVSLGIKDSIVSLTNENNFDNYENLLKKYYKQNSEDIDIIFDEIKKISKYMDVLYGIDNPLF
ncbi:hypothetical protein [Clostridium sp. DL1XJH146]